MESTTPTAKAEDSSDETADEVDDGVVQGFDNENWVCEESQEKDVSVAQESKVADVVPPEESTTNIDEAVCGVDANSDIPADQTGVGIDEGISTADAPKTSAATGGWAFGSTLTAFAGALQQVRCPADMSLAI